MTPQEAIKYLKGWHMLGGMQEAIAALEPLIPKPKYWVEPAPLKCWEPFIVRMAGNKSVADSIPTREAAEEIAAIYERVTP